MSQIRIVEPELVPILRRVYTELADFIHLHKLEQIVAAGPSAYPHIHAIQRAYKNRHGKELKVYSLGRLGEQLSANEFRDKKREALMFLKLHRPTLDISRHTLVFDETANSGRTLRNLKLLFGSTGATCKTATLKQTGVIGINVADFPGGPENELFSVRIHRGLRAGSARKETKDPRYLPWPAYMVQLHSELREIADSVPRKEQK